MKTIKISNEVYILGRIWMPRDVCAMEQILSLHDVENCKDEDGEITKDSVGRWVDTHSGDFSEVIDFAYDFTIGSEDFVGDWETEDNEMAYFDCMFPEYE